MWNVDHIKPLSKFNLKDPRQFVLACHYTNLQPLWWKDNLTKRAREELGVDRCLRLVGNLANTSYCNASDRFLAKKLGVSERTVRRYLLTLKNKGLLTRTTVPLRRAGRWSRKRLMKLRSEQPCFGPSEHEVLDFRRKVSASAPATKLAEQPSHPLEAYRVAINEVEGFGDPYHEGMKTGDRPGQDAIIVPKSVLEKRVAEIRAMQAAGLKPDPEVQKLRSKYILARARQRKENA